MESVKCEVLTLLYPGQVGWTCCVLLRCLSLGLSQRWREFSAEPAPGLMAEVAHFSAPCLLTASRRGQLLLGWLLPSHVSEADLAPMWDRHLNHRNARTEAMVLIQSRGTAIWGPRHSCQCFSLNLVHTRPDQ